ncbi:1,5-anhydro-D-fructose reductase [Armadillidium nasatum]|uniref:1,5-anhydro-D-fructose reductase n=1 Tax=Armadillidium nasatum TaxID=96803 RepID=A0A5N5SMH2_9CRUS|nr:1,5-anhydro-D-fructose reductase [Armadillidium nasatum]
MESVPCITLNTGYKMPTIGLGTALANDDEMRMALNFALDCGYRSIDTAYLYLNEEAIGDALQDWFKKGKLKREDVFVTSKLPAIGNRPVDCERFLTMSLKKLKLDYLDFDINIRSIPGLDNPNATLNEMVTAEGPSLMDDETDIETLWKCLEEEFPVAVNQVELHPYLQQHKLAEFCQNLGIAVMGFGPFASPYTPEEMNVLTDPVILKIAKKYGKKPAQIILRSQIQRNIIVIPKSSNPERIKSNFDILNFTLSDGDMEALKKLDKGEKGRVYHFKHAFTGCEKHKEYPFHIEF